MIEHELEERLANFIADSKEVGLLGSVLTATLKRNFGEARIDKANGMSEILISEGLRISV